MGVLAGSLGALKGRWLVLAFPLGLLAGLVLGANDRFSFQQGRQRTPGMILVLGLLLAAAPRIPTAPLCVIAFGFGRDARRRECRRCWIRHQSAAVRGGSSLRRLRRDHAHHGP